jgi:glycosyltransferase involved in cell wall biosynthesis
VLFTCEQERLLARKSFWLYKANEEVLAYGIAPNTGNVEQQKNIFLSQFPVLKGKRLIFFLGRLHPKKGCDLLIKAFSALAHCDNNLHLVMAGPDQIGWKKKLEKIAGNFGIADKVCWTGMIPHDLVWGGLNCAEVFILPSHQENFGISVAQAISCGVPVLITDKVNIWREIDNCHAGFVGRDDLAGVADLLKRWLDLTEDQKAALRENARRCFIGHFRIDKTMQELVVLLKRYGV